MSNVKKLSEIEAKPVLRNKTFFRDLDILYGTSDPEKGDIQGNIGMPKGKISLWAGESGVGKSRLCIEVAKNFSTGYSDNGIVLYFQTESPLSDFASWAKDTKQYDMIYCSGEDRIDEIIKIIYEVKPKLVFIDSVNEIEEFENGNKKEARRLIKGIDGKPGLKKVTHDVGCHTILLGQINQDGKTIKGGTSLPHLVDIALNVVKTEVKAIFRVEVGTKHRYGSGETVATFMHNDDGVTDLWLSDDTASIVTPNVVTPNVVTPNVVTPNGPRRVKALTASGFVTVDADGNPNHDDPEWQEHVTNYAKRQGIDFNKLGPKKGFLTRLNEGVGNMFGLEN